MHFLRYFSGIFLYGFHIFRRNMDGRNDAGRISGMNARKLDMLHNGRNKSMGTVTDGVGFTFHGMVQETVNEDGGGRGVTPTAAFI